MNEAGTALALSDAMVHALEAIGTLIGSFVAILIFWMKLSDRINSADAKAEAATKSAAASLARVIKTEEELVSHRVMVAAEYVKVGMLNDFRTEIVGAINRLSDQFIATFKGTH